MTVTSLPVIPSKFLSTSGQKRQAPDGKPFFLAPQRTAAAVECSKPFCSASPSLFLTFPALVAMSSSNLTGVLEQGAAAPASPGGATAKKAAGAEASTERRDKLFLYDAAAVQALNPYGCSQFTDSSAEEVWNMVIKSNNRAKFHSELASDDAWRIGVGISRTAETLLEGIQMLRTANMAKLLKAEPLTLALEEAAALQPYLEALNFGKGSEKDASPGNLASLKRRKLEDAAAPPSKEAVTEAADALRAWLQQNNSPLRAIFVVLAGSGAFWAAHVAEKVVRAAIIHKPLEGPAMRNAALARRKEHAAGTSSSAAADDASGLFS